MNREKENFKHALRNLELQIEKILDLEKYPEISNLLLELQEVYAEAVDALEEEKNKNKKAESVIGTMKFANAVLSGMLRDTIDSLEA